MSDVPVSKLKKLFFALHFLALLALIPAFISTIPLCAAPLGDGPALGPLGGRNLFLPAMPWFNFPADRAAAMTRGTVVARSALYFVNEFDTYPSDMSTYTLDENNKLTAQDQKDTISMDYESTVWEIGIDWQAEERIRFSVDWRMHIVYGGFMDPIIEWFHTTLGVNNAGREYYDQNLARWNIESKSGFNYSGNGTLVAPGDLDIRSVWTLYQRKSLALAVGGALKLPFGQRSVGWGSGYVDVALEFLVDWKPWKRWVFYANVGMIIPFDGQAAIMGQFIPAVEFRLSRRISAILQMNVQSAAIINSIQYEHKPYGNVEYLSLPQTDLKIGIKGRYGRFEWQVYIEEDTFTWAGPDIILFLGAGYRF